MTYLFMAKDLQSLYGQRFSITNNATRSAELIEVQGKEVFPARAGLEGYGLRATHRHSTRGHVHSFLKIFQKNVPQRHQRSQFLVRVGLAKEHEWVFQGVPYAWLNKGRVNGVEIVGHLTKFIGLQYGAPGEDFAVLKDDGKWDAFSSDDRRSLATHLAIAIDALEKLSLVHGDLSPGNLMIGPGPNGTDICCLCDFDGFFHPSVNMLPRRFDGDLIRPVGSEGYQYSELVEKIAADINNDDETIRVESDRFALAALICEMMVWNTGLTEILGRGELLSKETIKARRLIDIPEAIRAAFPEGFVLLEKALDAGSCDSMPSPDDWLDCLAQPSKAQFHSTPLLLFYRGQGDQRALHRRAIIGANRSGSFGNIHSELIGVAFKRSAAHGLTLGVEGQFPVALQRNGEQHNLDLEERGALIVAPDDVLRLGDWEIEFKDGNDSLAEE